MPGRVGAASRPGVPAPANRHATPRAASARFAWPTSAGSAGGSTMLAPGPPPGRSPTATSLPVASRLPSRSTAMAAPRNGPASGPTVTRAGGAAPHTHGRASAARRSSGPRSATPRGGHRRAVEDRRGGARPRGRRRARRGGPDAAHSRERRFPGAGPGDAVGQDEPQPIRGPGAGEGGVRDRLEAVEARPPVHDHAGGPRIVEDEGERGRRAHGGPPRAGPAQTAPGRAGTSPDEGGGRTAAAGGAPA